MTEVFPGLLVGGAELCNDRHDETAVLHACKDPCHRTAVGYNTKTNLPPSHPEYLVAARGRHLYLNLIDPPMPLFRLESFLAALDYIDREIAKGQVTIHCNGGWSRAPSLALIWLAKRAKAIPAGSFDEAREAFEKLYPDGYAPGIGISTYLASNWGAIR